MYYNKTLCIYDNCICIYRPPASTNTFVDTLIFFLEITLQFNENPYIFGNFNIQSKYYIIRGFASNTCLGHWFNLFITKSTCNNIKVIFPTDRLSYILSRDTV